MQISTTTAPLEIERKYLIKMPDTTLLSAVSTRRINITQIYLTRSASGYSRRIRKSEENGSTEYVYSEKRKISDIVREEREYVISADEYSSLLKEADPKLKTISKSRWCIPYKAHTLEIDVFPFWDDRAILEVELAATDEYFELPDWIGQVCEVSSDNRYLNTSLARNIVTEPMAEFAWRPAVYAANTEQLDELK